MHQICWRGEARGVASRVPHPGFIVLFRLTAFLAVSLTPFAASANWDEFYSFDPRIRPAQTLIDRDTEQYTRKVQQALSGIGCYTARVDGWWSSGSKNAFAAASQKSNGFPASAKRSRADFLAYLATLPVGYCTTSEKYCNLPTAGTKWLNSRSPENFGSAFETMSKIFESYTGTIAAPDPALTAWLGRSGELGNVQRDLAYHLDQVLRLRRELASSWALATYESCSRCVLVEAFERLQALVVRPQKGKPYIGTSAPIEVDSITFDALRASHLTILDWSAKDEAYRTAQTKLLASSGNDPNEALEFANALRAADDAKREVLRELRANITGSAVQEAVSPAKVLENKNDYCGSMSWTEG